MMDSETIVRKKEGARLYRGSLKIDFYTQSVLIILTLLSLGYIFLLDGRERFFVIFFLLLQFEQLISATYFIARYTNKARKIYLLALLGGMILLVLMICAGIGSEFWFMLVFAVPISCIALTIFYFGVTYRDWKRSRSEVRSMDNIIDYKTDDL